VTNGKLYLCTGCKPKVPERWLDPQKLNCVQEKKSCPQGTHYQPNTNTCDKCLEGCADCDSNAICSVCYEGFTMNKDKVCCIDSCKNCASSSKCDECADGYWYFEKNQECIRKVDCSEGQWYNATGNMCKHCEDKNCAECDNSGRNCLRCKDTFKINATSETGYKSC